MWQSRPLFVAAGWACPHPFVPCISADSTAGFDRYPGHTGLHLRGPLSPPFADLEALRSRAFCCSTGFS